ncbi:MAG: TetM/TetW/TetO/TetS family tetracycline resistance ribosomal protection protein [Oscillospiraceae bacterium]|nr:TetM/TetW/TetO/TetS family tetracycline resistance ribosomal protection protein [Oscillospiraceae bacterium]
MTKTPFTLGILAHVDAGKTTLSEAMLYLSGARRTLGRVDHRDAFLDTHSLERARGITIFSKQAILQTQHRTITLVDTPGHVDFSAEAERVLPVLDCAVLVISGIDGIQSHTLTLWDLLGRYKVPTVVFVSKMDLPGKGREEILTQLQTHFGNCADFSADRAIWLEQAAMCDEQLLEQYLQTGDVEDAAIRQLVQHRKLIPCCFGAGLKLEGVDTLLDILDRYGPVDSYQDTFGAQIYKISRDSQNNRLTWLKVTGGSLKNRQLLGYRTQKGEEITEKVIQLRQYSGDKFTTPEEVFAGELVAVTGLSSTYAGQSLGDQAAAGAPVLEPVMTYRLNLSSGCDPVSVLPKLRLLEEEDPLLRILWDDHLKQIHVQIMGKVQLEVLRSLILERFGLEVTLDDQKIYYKETIAAPVEGVGHFEPLRHYAEVHLLLEPLPQGSGLVFDTVCPLDVLDANYQKLILAHLSEKTHRGVLTGAPITDMKLTLLVGKAHLKHTEGGDFRQATYRAVRQGLMQAESILLEPWYRFTLTVPTAQIGRAITDIRAMSGEFEGPDAQGTNSILSGLVPASELGDYASQVAAYTQGTGQLQLTLHGYAPCHNQDAVVAAADYDPESDLENTSDSVFCSHGAGFTVKWDQVQAYMHLESGLQKESQPELITRNIRLDDKELEAIMLREFGPVKRPLYRAPENRPAREEVTIRPPRDNAIIVDGYNIIFAWEELSKLALHDLDAARRRLCDLLSSFAGFKKCYLVVVFDGYKVKDNPGEKEQFHNIHIVYTKENQTADAYIEALADQIGRNYAVRVATSDGLVQLSSLRSGVLRMSARELQTEVEATRKEMQSYF